MDIFWRFLGQKSVKKMENGHFLIQDQGRFWPGPDQDLANPGQVLVRRRPPPPSGNQFGRGLGGETFQGSPDL